MKRYFLAALLLWMSVPLVAQEYEVKVTSPKRPLLEGHLKMGDPGWPGQEIRVNNRYLTLGGKPVVPVMGEIHFSRVPRKRWRESLLKMKANGINIVATYIFWIHHEEAEGIFDWREGKDFRAFAELCGELGLWVYPRVGPWCHGEVRNGATPDWILKKTMLSNRTNDPVYQAYVERYFRQIVRQCQGLLYKDGGPIIGVQLENEYWRGKGGEAHILWLKNTLRQLGMDVPLYTVTGWGNVSVPEDEVIPLYGGYPEEPWATNTDRPSSAEVFFFDTNRDSEAIGNEQLKKDGKYVVDISRYPYFTCELGVGNQISWHRRPVISPLDGLAIALVKVGSGSNLPGYYVFTGGTNPRSWFSPMQEDQHETGMYNEYPAMSYDFQAAIRETGQLAPSYYQVKKLHYFLNEFGELLAPYPAFFPETKDRNKELQFSVRSDGRRGFVFGSNYVRGQQRPEYKRVQFRIELADGEQLVFPEKPVTVRDSALFIFPFHFDLQGVELRYATAQLLARPQPDSWVLFTPSGIEPVFAFADGEVERVEVTSGKAMRKNGEWLVTGMKAGIGEQIVVKTRDGGVRNLYLLTEQEALQSWLFRADGRKYFCISDADMTLEGENLQLNVCRPETELYTCNSFSFPKQIGEAIVVRKDNIGKWQHWQFHRPVRKPGIQLTESSVFAEALPLKVNVEKKSAKQQLWQKFFFKEFGLYHAAPVRRATLYLYSDLQPSLRLNGKYVNQYPESGKLSRIDLTGYVQKGENLLQLGFPLTPEAARMLAVVEVVFHNGDKVRIPTGRDWLTTEQYVAPASWTSLKGKAKAAEVLAGEEIKGEEEQKYYDLFVPEDAFEGVHQLYVGIDYSGDQGCCYFNQQLLWDNFNNGTPWEMNLSDDASLIRAGKLHMVITPLQEKAAIRLDKAIGNQPFIHKITVTPEYQIVLPLK